LCALIATCALVLSSCGSRSTSNVAQAAGPTGDRRSAITQPADLAAHADAVAGRKAAAQNWARLVAALRRVWRHRHAANRTAQQTAARPVFRTVVEMIGSTAIDICGPNGSHGASRAERHARARLRHLALYYLNLSCPRS
jgi:hypothetical protein